MIRLQQDNLEKVKIAIRSGFGDSEFYFFGSRCEMQKKGGDIDIAIVAEEKDFFERKLKSLTTWEMMEIPIALDIVCYKDDMDLLLKQEIDRWKKN